MISPPESAAHVPLNLKSVFVEAFLPESYGNGGEKLGNSSLVWSVLKKNSTRAVREARAARKPTPRIIKTITIHTLRLRIIAKQDYYRLRTRENNSRRYTYT